MRFGLFGINMDVLATDPGAAVAVAVAAEEAGWDSVWTGEHYVLPDPWVQPSPAPPDLPMLDPFVALTNVAAHTSRLRVGTGVTVLPYHQPLVLAKQVASLDRVAGGRFEFGVGVGYLAQEFAALGVPMADRAARSTEYLDAIRAIWTQAPAAHDGRYVRFSGVAAEPRPVHPAGPPVHFGGGVPRTFRRAVTQGRGWFGFALDPAATERAVAGLRLAEREHPRPAELGPLEITVTPDPRLPIDDDTVAAYARLGVTRLVPLPPDRLDPDRIIAFVRAVATRHLD
ncbi:MAG TPA: TIGR03619 family F420-dependent LLM class oxidoreductase [Actinophytocola sp.]|uniref:TIGR03619 family F420-dependent LLM class oxidoreductase n=1 Tax=Actinophytocola sp. TaxID=1872138 RepID=UPI002DB6C6DF|nr:TIGR03619 family F420-dependent LLM class oxidoreductase [Actinophytocola sp.]HEU5471519.1 TIGR03619 family F420-dependent LLM class oxidoreductase [Actinophytocola sp.]